MFSYVGLVGGLWTSITSQSGFPEQVNHLGHIFNTLVIGTRLGLRIQRMCPESNVIFVCVCVCVCFALAEEIIFDPRSLIQSVLKGTPV